LGAVTRGLVTFPSKLLLVAALRDPAIQNKYPHLAISRDTLSLPKT
jgi:hypothetical protein